MRAHASFMLWIAPFRGFNELRLVIRLKIFTDGYSEFLTDRYR
jgi:uncharacterized protein YfdQ (DUF2303 family)